MDLSIKISDNNLDVNPPEKCIELMIVSNYGSVHCFLYF